MLKDTVLAALNEQLNAELYSAYLYLSMSAYCESRNLPGFAGWMRRQHDEESAHAMKIFDYVHDQGARVTLKAVAQPPAEFKSLQDVWEQTLAHEQKITGFIHKLVELAEKESDYATRAMLQWFVTEQVEEEKAATRILEQVRMVGTSSSAMFFLDRHVAKGKE